MQWVLAYNRGMITVAAVSSFLEQWAAPDLAADWDNVGLQIGTRHAEVTEIVIAMDADDVVLDYLKDKQQVLVITHHPLFFKGLKQLRYDQEMGRIVRAFVTGNHCLYSAHTNLDAAEGGVNDCLVQAYGLDPKQGAIISAGFGKVFTGLDLEFRTFLKTHSCIQEGARFDTPVQKVAFCCGSGHGFIQNVIDLDCDTLVTGEINYHDHLRCQMNGIRVLRLGHKESEVFVLAEIKARLADIFPEVPCHILT